MKEKNSATASTLGRILATCSKQVMIIRMALPRSPGRIMLGYILWEKPKETQCNSRQPAEINATL
ncbi:hypothetical protein HA466_0023110 [Hirschfeldia incana]|nr:hypothetical protein HA466_0023110 [Hirschfeldia incana]